MIMAPSLIGVMKNQVKGNSEPEIVRRLANFPPSIWGNRFTSISIDNQARETYVKEIERLKGEVGDMFVGRKPEEVMNLINTLERLGVSYHLEEEIEKQLEKMFHDVDRDAKFENYDLFTTALFFRVYRQHGYNLSSGVFQKFKNSDEHFKEELIEDAQGMLSLYEATHVRTHGDDILDEAFAFTTSCLESMADTLSPHLGKQVMHALKQSLHKGIPRIEARNYISVYEEDPSKNDLLLRFAMLDFNLLQMLHKEELCHLSRWWEELDFASTLPYSRNRAVECYLWAVTVYFEPKYSIARIMLAKTMLMFSITDDTYDAYGTLEELQIYTEAIQRWDIGAINQLPEYMKIIYTALLNLYEEIEKELSKQKNSYGARYSIEAFKEVVRCYDTETKWFHAKFVPLFDDYMRNALVTGSNFLHAISSFMGMGDVATIQAFDWAQSKPKSLIASNTIGRLIDDIMSHEEEQKRGHAATGLECYMNEYGVSKEEAIAKFYERIENAWKDINKECLKPTPIGMPLIIRVLNLTRVLDVVYKHEDGYTHPEKVLKHHVISLFIEAIPI